MLELYVYCRRGGVSRDAGLHARYADAAEAAREMPADLAFLRRHYDEVSYRLVEQPETAAAGMEQP